MKHLSKILVALVLALVMAATLPAQVFADAAPEYISEVKIGMGKEAKDAKAALEGYKILSDEKGNPVDLNQKAGGGLGSKGEKVVYLGYKTTTDRKDAVTDLALMNMKGGYSVQEYEALMETQMKSQIIPFVDGFLAAINEYRANYSSSNAANKQRAEYIKKILDKFIDDDTGKGLGELLLNKTKYELGDEAYNKLSDEEKKNHADILTIFAQSNGKATLMMENLITRAADTGENTWLDRFAETTLEGLADAIDMLPTDAENELAKQYDDDARKILKMWSSFREDLEGYESAKDTVDDFDGDDYEEAFDAAENIGDNATQTEAADVLGDFVDAQTGLFAAAADAQTVAVYEKLREYEYGDGTLLDFFMQPAEDIAENISVLYPLVACLSEGQRAGIEFVSLKELVCIAITDAEGYGDADLDSLEEISIYSGVDRGIYQKGGVALTSDALRANAIEEAAEDDSVLSGWTIAAMVVTGLTVVAFAASAYSWVSNAAKLTQLTEQINQHRSVLGMIWGTNPAYTGPKGNIKFGGWTVNDVFAEGEHPEWRGPYESATSGTALSKGLTIGLGVAMVVLAAVTTYLSYRDMVNHYKVDFTPIPHYMVDEKDIIAYNEKGEKTVIKNQPAYYKAVECNRIKNDEMFDTLGTCADMNGDVGRQWLALYAQKSDVAAPIIASSLLVKVNDSNVPAGYTTGIHMFGFGAAFNLNSELYDWNKSAPGIMVYFKVDTAAAKAAAAGSNFSAGALALTAGAGLAIGALISGIAVNAAGKKKSKKAEA